MNILLVEDSKTQADLIQKLMSKILYIEVINVIHALDAYDAYLKLHSGLKYDLIIADYEMPYSTGLEFLRKLKNTANISNIPVLITSVHDNREECMAHGASGHLKKPFNKDAILAHIEKIMKKMNR